MKRLLILLPLINGCSTYSLLGEMGDRGPQEYIEKVESGEEPRVAYYGLTSQGYENLSMTMGEITRYLEQILHIVDYYRDIDEDEEEKNEK